MNCPKCGVELESETPFCPNCGCSLSDPDREMTIHVPKPEKQYPTQPERRPQSQPQPQPQPQPRPQTYENGYRQKPEIPAQYRLMRPWSYFWLSVLYSVPVVGFIFLIVFTFNKGNLNRRNYTRSYWCGLLVLLIIAAIVTIILALTGSLNAVLDELRFYFSRLY